jgi:hypothetical protein
MATRVLSRTLVLLTAVIVGSTVGVTAGMTSKEQPASAAEASAWCIPVGANNHHYSVGSLITNQFDPFGLGYIARSDAPHFSNEDCTATANAAEWYLKADSWLIGGWFNTCAYVGPVYNTDEDPNYAPESLSFVDFAYGFNACIGTEWYQNITTGGHRHGTSWHTTPLASGGEFYW